jgi:hypothetical protein
MLLPGWNLSASVGIGVPHRLHGSPGTHGVYLICSLSFRPSALAWLLKFPVNHFGFGRGDCQRIAPVILV